MNETIQTTCRFCGREGAAVRASELGVAAITGRAHVDCQGHAQYRALTPEEHRQVKARVKSPAFRPSAEEVC